MPLEVKYNGEGEGMASDRIKSRQRVQEYGEVLTPRHIVNAMPDLVKQETERIDLRVLKPAWCAGNFLFETSGANCGWRKRAMRGERGYAVSKVFSHSFFIVFCTEFCVKHSQHPY